MTQKMLERLKTESRLKGICVKSHVLYTNIGGRFCTRRIGGKLLCATNFVMLNDPSLV